MFGHHPVKHLGTIASETSCDDNKHLPKQSYKHKTKYWQRNCNLLSYTGWDCLKCKHNLSIAWGWDSGK